MPSGRSWTPTPILSSSRARAAIRSDSFTLSSAASPIVVTPRAHAAATASTGISSMSRGMSAPPIEVAVSSDADARRSAAGSASSPVGAGSIRRRALIASRTSRTPVRVGFTPTRWIVTPGSPIIVAATSRKAADEMSPGTETVVPRRSPGVSVTDRSPVTSCAPNCRSIRSEWSRDGAGSVTDTGPSAYSPASRTADLTWADATGESWVIARSGRVPFTASGSLLPPDRPTIAAPIRRNGSATRPLRPPRRDSSPAGTNPNGRPPRARHDARRTCRPALRPSGRAAAPDARGTSPQSLARRLDPRQRRPQRLGRAGVDGAPEVGESLLEALDARRQRVAVRQEDLGPHLRITGRDARGIPKPASREVERGRLDAARAVDQGARDQVRQVADRRPRAVMRLGIQRAHAGAQRLPELRGPLERGELGPVRRRHDDRGATEQIGAGRAVAALLRARERVTAHEGQWPRVGEPLGRTYDVRSEE